MLQPYSGDPRASGNSRCQYSRESKPLAVDKQRTGIRSTHHKAPWCGVRQHLAATQENDGAKMHNSMRVEVQVEVFQAVESKIGSKLNLRLPIVRTAAKLCHIFDIAMARPLL